MANRYAIAVPNIAIIHVAIIDTFKERNKGNKIDSDMTEISDIMGVF
ncbi:MAG: hypothetical protein ACE5KE_11905 [Methanosarcinales archaeon]